MDARHPKSGLPDFGTNIAEIGNSRFRLLAAILRDARKSALLRMRSELLLALSLTIVLKCTDVGQDGDDLAFREGAAECRHGAGLAVADARDDVVVAALGPRQLRPLAFRAAAVWVAVAAQGRKHSRAIDVVGRCLGRPSLGLVRQAGTLLRLSASGRQRESESCERRALARDRYPHRECWAAARKAPGRPSLYCLSANTNRAPVFFAMLLKGSPHSAANSSDTRLPQPAGTAMYCLPPAM